MAEQATTGRGARSRTWLTTIALAAVFPLVVAIPAPAQETIDPMEAMRLEFDACIARGEEGAECAATAKLTLEAIMSGDAIPVSAGATTEPAAPEGESVTGGEQINSSGGQDGEVSNGGDPAISDDTTGDTTGETTGEAATEAETAPAPAGDQALPADTTAPAAEGTTPPPAEGSTPPAADGTPQPGSTTTTTTTTEDGTTTGSTSTLSGGAQSENASGTDGGRRRNQD